MYSVQMYARVRHAVMREGLSQREAARQFGLDRKTVAKDLSRNKIRVSETSEIVHDDFPTSSRSYHEHLLR